MTQNERILGRLKMGTMCAMEPLDWSPRITRTAARVQDLRDRGYTIQTFTDCYLHDQPQHHAQYRLATEDQGALF